MHLGCGTRYSPEGEEEFRQDVEHHFRQHGARDVEITLVYMQDLEAARSAIIPRAMNKSTFFFTNTRVKKNCSKAHAAACLDLGPSGHGERSRLQLLLKLAGTVTAVFTFWLFKFGCASNTVHVRVF